ncbi:MAG TPA: hypothetical protein VEO54_10630 [Thermoanaerobaculia bacterium]|nr:hypothetical protein [Thermoanaerobaculia bacterium]
MRLVAIVEPDAAQCEKLREAVEAAGLRAETFPSADAALERLRTRACALAIVGLDAGDDFYRVASALAPLIVVCQDCAPALESGADDCVARTTSARELAARIHSVLRRAPRPDESLSISIPEMRVRTPEAKHDLTRGETELLAVLLQHAPTPVPIKRLTELLGARRGTVESRIKSVRKKLGPGRLVSRGSLGYQLVEE